MSTKTRNEEVRKNFKISKNEVSVPRLVFLKFQNFLLTSSMFIFVFLFTIACIHCLCLALTCKFRSYSLVYFMGL
jgi:hypothetical protein